MGPRQILKEELFRRLQEWESEQVTPPTLWDAVRQDDGYIATAFITRAFRKAPAEAVQSRDRVTELRTLALLAFGGMAAQAEGFLRAPMLLHGRTPLEAAVESNHSMDEALRSLAIHLHEHVLALHDRIANSWALTKDESSIFLGSEGEKGGRWRSKPMLVPLHVVVRILTLLLVDKAMMTLCGSREAASDWLRSRSDAVPLNGDSPLSLMLSEGRAGIALVQEYLDHEIRNMSAKPAEYR